MADRPIGNSDIYDLVDRTRVEAKTDTIRLETKVDLLQKDVEQLKIRNATLSVKVYALVIIISGTVSTVFTALVQRALAK